MRRKTVFTGIVLTLAVCFAGCGAQEGQEQESAGQGQEMTEEELEEERDRIRGIYDVESQSAIREGLVLEKSGDFASQGGQHSITYVEDESLPEGQYYIYMFNNNIGVSETRPDFDWSVIDGIQSEAVDGTTSYYYKYLVDETAGSYELVESFEVPYSGYVSSVQEIGDNVVADSGMQGIWGEYDSENNLIRSFTMEKESFIYRVYKYEL